MTRSTLIGTLLYGAAATVAAEQQTLRDCIALDDPAARLACYDAVMGRPAGGGAAGASAPAPAAPAVPVPAPLPIAADFGMANSSLDSISARIVGKFTEWQNGTLIRLDNGQVWRAVVDRTSVYPNVPEDAEVEITRGVFGYRLEIKAIGRLIPVRRVS
jgi:hypothetical protein